MESVSAPSAVLIVQPSRLGDVLLTTTLLDDLRRAFPTARLDYLTRDSGAPLLVGHPLIRRVLAYTSSLVRDVRVIRSGRYDWVIDPHGGAGSVQRVLLSGAGVRAGFRVRAPRRYAYTHCLSRTAEVPRYTVDQRKGLLTMLGVPVTRSRARLFLSDAERSAGAQGLAAAGAPPGRPILGMTLTGATHRQSWPLDIAAAVANGAAADGFTPVVFAAPDDDARTTRFRAAAPAALIVPPGPLRSFLSMLPGCSVFASSDTGPAHFAMAVGVPTVTLYSKGRSAIWNPRDADTHVLEAPGEFDCPQCRLPKAESDDATHACLESIDAGRWLDAIRAAGRR